MLIGRATLPRGSAPPPIVRPEPLRYELTCLIASICVLVVSSVLAIDDSEHVTIGAVSLPPICALRTVTGLTCPGCGLTRCFVSAAHGRFEEAWTFHATGLLLFALVAAQVPFRSFQLARLARRVPAWRPAALRWLPWIVIAALVLEWFVRARWQPA